MHAQTSPSPPSHRKKSARPIAVLALSTMLLLSGCAALGGGISQSQSDDETENAESTTPTVRADENAEANAEATSRQSPARSETRASENGATPGGNRSGGGNSQGGGSANRPEDGEAILRLTGDSGTKFSGECEVGGERESIEGEIPDRFTFDLGNNSLACDIEKQDPGQMQLVFSTGNDNITQTTGADNTTISLVYEDGNVRIFQSAASSSSIQQSSGTSVTQSNVVIQNGSPSSDPNP